MKTKHLALAFCCWLLMTATGAAQPSQAAPAPELKRLDFLLGEWKGAGWIEMGPGRRAEFQQTEHVQSRLNGTVILVEGLGRGKMGSTGEEGVVHHALAVISYNTGAKKLAFRAFRADGNSVDADATVSDKGMVWGFRDPQRGMQVRYTIKLDEMGRWNEVGELSMDGQAWRKFFEMTLQRVK